MARPRRAGKHNWLCADTGARGRHGGARGKASSLWLSVGWGRQAAWRAAFFSARPSGSVAVARRDAACGDGALFALVLAGAGDRGDADLAIAVVERGSLACGALLL